MRLGIKKGRKLPSDKDLARDLGRLGEYLDYVTTHEVTHGRVLALATKSRHAGDTVHVYARTINDVLLVGVGIFAARAALRSLHACHAKRSSAGRAVIPRSCCPKLPHLTMNHWPNLGPAAEPVRRWRSIPAQTLYPRLRLTG